MPHSYKSCVRGRRAADEQGPRDARVRYLPRLCLMACLMAGQAVAAAEFLEPLSVGDSAAARTALMSGTQPGASPRPVILALHGGGSNARAFAAETGLAEAAGRAGFLVVFLEGSGSEADARTFNSGACCGDAHARAVDDVAYARSVVARLSAQGLADPARVYALGFSNGGMMAYRLAAQAPDLVAGVVAVSATLDIDPGQARAAKAVLHIHGTADPYVPYAGGVGAKASASAPRLAVDTTMRTWARLGCGGAEPATPLRQAAMADTAGDGTRVRRIDYGCVGAAPVTLYAIEGGGHAWPSGRQAVSPGSGPRTRNLDATALAVMFFRQLAWPSPVVK